VPKESVYTPMQRKFLAVLADGFMHLKEEFYVLMDPDWRKLAEADKKVIDQLSSCLRQQIHKIRPHLRAQGMDIISQYHKQRFYYRQIRLLASSVAG
jgi:hypothetical protein